VEQGKYGVFCFMVAGIVNKLFHTRLRNDGKKEFTGVVDVLTLNNIFFFRIKVAKCFS